MYKIAVIEVVNTKLLTMRDDDGIWISIRELSDGMGLELSGQLVKLKQDSRFILKNKVYTTNGGKQEKVSISVNQLPAYLYSINPSKVSEKAKPLVLKFQAETFEAINNYWLNGEAYKNDSNYVPYELLYSKERECIEMKRLLNRFTENEKLIFNDPQTHNDTLEFLGYASRAAKTMRQLANDTAEYAENMERFIVSIQKRHGHQKGVNTQCNRLPRHLVKKD